MPDYTLYDAVVTTLTPFHIGSGRDLLHEYDYAIHKGRTWRLNEDALLDAQDADDPRVADRLARTPPARLLDDSDYRLDAPFFRYVIRGTPRSSAEGAQVREQLKDSYDRPYLPGSSLKGALRTAIAWYAWAQLGLRTSQVTLGRDRRFAGQRIEQDIFGRDPNHDLLRALHVGDSQPAGQEQLMLLNARVFTGGGPAGAPIELEALRPETKLQLPLKVDEALFSDWARRHNLNLRGGDWLKDLPAVVWEHTARRLADECAWFSSAKGGRAIHGFYTQLQQVGHAKSRFLLQIGWGAGWDDKTLGSRLRADQGFMEDILQEYRMARGSRQAGDPFPKSRRVVVSVRRGPEGQIQESAVAPLGWALVELKPRTA